MPDWIMVRSEDVSWEPPVGDMPEEVMAFPTPIHCWTELELERYTYEVIWRVRYEGPLEADREAT